MSSLQALQFQYIILIPYILDDYTGSNLSQDTSYPDIGFLQLVLSLQASLRILAQIRP
jgi:hypothetical protein